ncbi:hypothetical protein NGRA_0572 [Nosema granulosis]|uniref:ISXO2-like transposase domain-containing protein n=1 Tax=Nosema granulosis TaxID=83296 RepID=A0A9P6H2T1_9MICR|nr:hypothetical protein NGRA_0572 [Nosema granulosis]
MLGDSKSVQIEDTVIYKSKLDTCPYNTSDNLKGCTWLVGIIEQDTGRMVIEIVPNRKIKTMIAYISKHVFVGSLVITDRYPSYIQAFKNAIYVPTRSLTTVKSLRALEAFTQTISKAFGPN